MATMTQANPISDLTFDWISVLHAKAEGLNAYRQYIEDAERAGAAECVKLLRKLHDADAKQVEEIKQHVKMMLQKN
jgi:hypothetical protein